MHHRDIATAVILSLTGAFDGSPINIVDEAPVTVGAIAQFLGVEHDASTEPLADPWRGHLDTSLARSLGFQATVPTLYQAQREGIL